MRIIYVATNRENGKQYVGKTIDSMKLRKRQHENDAGNGSILAFHEAIRKYGKGSFYWLVVAYIHGSVKDLNQAESYWIEKLGSRAPNGYNMTDGGDGGSTFLGRKHTEVSKAKMAAAKKRYKSTPEPIAKMKETKRQNRRAKSLV